MTENRVRIELGEMSGKAGDGAGGLDAGKSGDALEELLEKSGDLRRGALQVAAWDALHVVAAFRQFNAHGEEIAGIEAGIGAVQAQNRIDHQPRADEKNHGKSDFADSKSVPCETASSSRSTLAAFAKRFVQIGV